MEAAEVERVPPKVTDEVDVDAAVTATSTVNKNAPASLFLVRPRGRCVAVVPGVPWVGLAVHLLVLLVTLLLRLLQPRALVLASRAEDEWKDQYVTHE